VLLQFFGNSLIVVAQFRNLAAYYKRQALLIMKQLLDSFSENIL